MKNGMCITIFQDNQIIEKVYFHLNLILHNKRFILYKNSQSSYIDIMILVTE